MKSIQCPKYGPPEGLVLADVLKPTPGSGEVLVKIEAASINAADWHIMRADPWMVRLGMGFSKPKIKGLGADVAGRIEAVGTNVQHLKPGDEVFGDLSGCGFGSFAEYVCVPETVVIPKPANLSFIEAAAMPMAAVTALNGLRNAGKIKEGQKVLVLGATGGVGSFAVQLAQALGAEVTAVGSPAKADMLHSLGAKRVIDYTQVDVTKAGVEYDLILDAAAYRPIYAYRRALRPSGTYVLVGGAMGPLMQAGILGPIYGLLSGRKFKSYLSKPNPQDLLYIKQLAEEGKIHPVLDRTFPLAQVPEAIRHLEQRRAKGKVTINVT